MKTPSFSWMGGKARLRKWLISHFPKSGRRYIEPFAGRGNVFFQARKDLNFQEWHLNDLDADFFFAILDADLDKLPAQIETKEEFNYWKNLDNDVAKIIEPRITFGGKGYSAGWKGNTALLKGKHIGYSSHCYRPMCEEARRLLQDVKITQMSYDEIDCSTLNHDDFVYFDPPYFGTKASYPNIDHEKLIKILNSENFRWALSGYDNEMYSSNLKFVSRFEKERNSEIKGSNTQKYEAVVETLWTNY